MKVRQQSRVLLGECWRRLIASETEIILDLAPSRQLAGLVLTKTSVAYVALEGAHIARRLDLLPGHAGS